MIRKALLALTALLLLAGNLVFASDYRFIDDRHRVETLLEKAATKVYAGVINLNSAESLIGQYGDRVEVIKIDLSKPEAITAAAKHAADVEVVVNNAVVMESSTPLDVDALDSLNYEMEINVGGLIRMAQAFAPVLKVNGGSAFKTFRRILLKRTSGKPDDYTLTIVSFPNETGARKDYPTFEHSDGNGLFNGHDDIRKRSGIRSV